MKRSPSHALSRSIIAMYTAIAACLSIVAPASASGDLEWVELSVPGALEREGLRTMRLYARVPEPGARLALAGSGRAAGEGRAVGQLVFSAPVWQHPMGGDAGIAGAEFLDPTLPFDTFVMIGEPGDARFDFVGGTSGGGGPAVTWDSGINVVWFTLGRVTGISDRRVFGDSDRRVAVMQVTLPRGADAAGDVVLGWLGAGGRSIVTTQRVPSMHGGAPATGASRVTSADLDGDGSVDAGDLFELLGAWGTGGADLDGDGVTSVGDLGLLARAMGVDRDTLDDRAWRGAVIDLYRDEVQPAMRALGRADRAQIASRFLSLLRLRELPEASVAAPPRPGPGDSGDGGDGGGDDDADPSPSTPAPSRGGPDVTGDGFVGAADVAAVLGSFGRSGGDVNGDGATRRDDLVEVFAAIGLDPRGLDRRTWNNTVMPFYVNDLRALIDRLPTNARRRAPGLVFGLSD